MLACALACVIQATAADAAGRAVDRGIVLRVAPSALVVRELDGSRVRFRITRSSPITLDGRPAGLNELARGDVAVVVHKGFRATSVRAVRP